MILLCLAGNCAGAPLGFGGCLRLSHMVPVLPLPRPCGQNPSRCNCASMAPGRERGPPPLL